MIGRYEGSDAGAGLTIRADTNGLISFWGADVATVMGHSAAEAVGQRVDLVIPAALRPFHWRGFDKAIRTGAMRRPGATVKVPALHRDGRVIAVRAELNLVRNSDGAIEGAEATNLRLSPSWVATLWRPVLAIVGLVARRRFGS